MAKLFRNPAPIDMTDDMEHAVSEEVKAERIRRMKALVRQMHKEDLEPKRTFIPPIRARGLIAAVSFLAVLLFSMSSLYNYNRFIDLGEQVKSNKGHVEAALQRRSNLFVNLVNLTLNHAALEEEIFRHVANVRTEMNNTKTLLSDVIQDPAALGGNGKSAPMTLAPSAASSIKSSMARLLAVVEQYPDIQSSSTYQQLMDKLVEIENRIAQRRNEYNEAVRYYNKTISSFPWFLLAKATGFGRYEYYKGEKTMRQGPVISTKTFERLLPNPDKKK